LDQALLKVVRASNDPKQTWIGVCPILGVVYHQLHLAADAPNPRLDVEFENVSGTDEVRTRYGVDPKQVPDSIALRGDSSDKIPGAPGVGATGAATLLQRYGSLEAAVAAGRFPAMAESLRLYRSIAMMDKKAPLPSLRSQKPAWDKAAALAGEWELNQLARRLEELGTRNSDAKRRR
jgi:5'-3' exonuclease